MSALLQLKAPLCLSADSQSSSGAVDAQSSEDLFLKQVVISVDKMFFIAENRCNYAPAHKCLPATGTAALK